MTIIIFYFNAYTSYIFRLPHRRAYNCFYSVSISWLCDIINVPDRGAAFGMYTGLCIGLGFTFGLPIGFVLLIYELYVISSAQLRSKIGAALSATKGPDLPLYISAVIALTNASVVLLLPINDVIGAEEKRKVIIAGQTGIEITSPVHNSISANTKDSSLSDPSEIGNSRGGASSKSQYCASNGLIGRILLGRSLPPSACKC